MGRSLLLILVVALLAFGCSSSDEEQRGDQPARETTGERSAPLEETTSPRERTNEETTSFEFSVGRTPMDEEEDDDDRNVVRQREAVVQKAPQPPGKSQEQYSPEPTPSPESEPEPEAECRFFTQSEFANADPEQKAFIRECDRAAGRVPSSASPVQEERDANEPPQERAVQPEPQPESRPVPEPQSGGGRLTCEGLSPAEAQAALPANPQLDRDGDGEACER